MEKGITVEELKRLSIAQRIELVEDLWDTIAENAESVSVTDEQKRLLDKRLDSQTESPDAGSSWEDVKKRVRGK